MTGHDRMNASPEKLARRTGLTTMPMFQNPSDAQCIEILEAVTGPLGEEPIQATWAQAAISRCRKALVASNVTQPKPTETALENAAHNLCRFDHGDMDEDGDFYRAQSRIAFGVTSVNEESSSTIRDEL